MANTLIEARLELSLANRIVAHEGIIDAFGHVSMRHPDNPNRYFLSRSRAPELVSPDDFIEYDLDSQKIAPGDVPQYSERVIHGEIYKARPEVMSVCHHHCPAFIPLLATGVPTTCRFSTSARSAASGRRSGTSTTNSATPTCW